MIAAVALAAAVAGGPASLARASAVRARLPPIQHVWVIELENTAYADSFGDPAADPYLARTLPAQGALLTQYYAIGHDSAANYIAQISGQAPNPATSADCGTYSGFSPAPAGRPTFTRDGQIVGDGCVFPAAVQTIGNQLTATHRSWKAYEQDMGNTPPRDGVIRGPGGPGCGHPPRLGDADLTVVPSSRDSYATRHDPFVYFEAVIGSPRYCAAHVVALTPLRRDLRRAATTPSYSFVTPDSCSDGHDEPVCANGQPGGLVQVDAFLGRWVPVIMASRAYRSGGLIVITFDEALGNQTQACCGERVGGGSPSHPNMAAPGITGPGGGRVGAVLLSPFIRPGTRSRDPYNHYALLRSIEELFGLPPLGDAAEPGVHGFGRDVYTNWPRPGRAA